MTYNKGISYFFLYIMKKTGASFYIVYVFTSNEVFYFFFQTWQKSFVTVYLIVKL